MFRRLLTIASVLSVLLCIVFATLWWRSRIGLGGAACAIGHEFFEFGTEPDRLVVIWANGWPTPESPRFFSLADNSRAAHPVFRSIERNPQGQSSGSIFLRDSWTATTPLNPDGSARWMTPAQSSLATGGASPLSRPMQFHSVTVPFLFLFWITAVLPLLYANHRFMKSRRNAGVCPACGCDLRPGKNRCPQCGQPIDLSKPPSDQLEVKE